MHARVEKWHTSLLAFTCFISTVGSLYHSQRTNHIAGKNISKYTNLCYIYIYIYIYSLRPKISIAMGSMLIKLLTRFIENISNIYISK
jgi:hypothetical protein